mgnify:CR=1 FL=1
MVKVQIFKHMSHGALTDKINHFIADQHLKPEDIHDIKLAAGPENSMIAMIIYFLKRMKYVKKSLLKVTVIFYSTVFGLIALFLLIVVGHMVVENIPMDGEWFLDTLWRDVHHILFMFQPEKVEGSFFNDILTEVLTLELFIKALVIVVIVLISMLTMWLVTTILARKYGDQISEKIFKKKSRN